MTTLDAIAGKIIKEQEMVIGPLSAEIATTLERAENLIVALNALL